MQEKEFLYNEVKRLIECGHEGSYWDFKEQWYHDKASMLHDIICMANNIENRDSYIIIGVSDDCSMLGYDKSDDAPERHNTQELNCFLRNKHFMGGLRPSVHVVPLLISKNKIDVIVVENSKNTPFILSEDFIANYKTIHKYHIYSRIQDSNTPIDKNADINIVEALWRKRFRINSAPIEKLKFYLENPDDWELDCNSYCRENYYYKFDPAYTISFEIKEEDDFEAFGPDFLCKLFSDKQNDGYNTAQFKVYDSVIREMYYTNNDGGRYRSIYPCDIAIPINGSQRHYLFMKYIIRESFEDLFNNFIRIKENKNYIMDYHNELWWRNVIFFDSESQKKEFIKYVKDNKYSIWEKFNKIEDRMYEEKKHYDKYEWNKGDSMNWRSMKVLKNEYNIFISKKIP